MPDCVLDTHILAEIISQYNPSNPISVINDCDAMSEELVREINKIIIYEGYNGLLVASSFAFIEVANKFDDVSKNRFTTERFYGFLRQPPVWFLIEPMSPDTCKHFIEIPKFSTKAEPIELADAIHVATALQRGPKTILATADHKLHDLSLRGISVIR